MIFLEKSCFAYLNKDYRYLNNYIRDINRLLFIAPNKAIKKEKIYIENLTQEIAKLKGDGLLNDISQYQRLKRLEEEGAFTEHIEEAFYLIRVSENSTAQAEEDIKLEAALNIYKNIYKITNWFIKEYVNSEAEICDYKSPMPLEGREYPIGREKILDIIKKQEITEEANDKIETSQSRKDRNNLNTDFWLENIFN